MVLQYQCEILQDLGQEDSLQNLEKYLPSIFNKKELRKTIRAFGSVRKSRVQFCVGVVAELMRKHALDFHCDFQQDVVFESQFARLPDSVLPADAELHFKVT